MERPLRSPIDVAIRAFAISRKQRFDLELRSVPESVDVVVLPAPVDDRELVRLLRRPGPDGRRAHRLADQALDERGRRQAPPAPAPPPWWRRDAEVS